MINQFLAFCTWSPFSHGWNDEAKATRLPRRISDLIPLSTLLESLRLWCLVSYKDRMSSRNLFTISVTHSFGVLEERSAELKCVCVCISQVKEIIGFLWATWQLSNSVYGSKRINNLHHLPFFHPFLMFTYLHRSCHQISAGAYLAHYKAWTVLMLLAPRNLELIKAGSRLIEWHKQAAKENNFVPSAEVIVVMLPPLRRTCPFPSSQQQHIVRCFIVRAPTWNNDSDTF